MSDLTEALESAFDDARGVIGEETLSIDGGRAWDCVRNEAENRRDYEFDRGQQESRTLRMVGKASEFASFYPRDAKEYLGKLAQDSKGETWTVISINIGDGAAQVDLVGENEAA